jgi:hypothetical protein
MVERDNWAGKFDSSGNAVVPAAPSPQEVVAAVERGEPPTREQQQELGVEPAAPATSNVPAKRGIDGIMRQDWNTAPVEVARKSFSGLPDWDKPRDEQGRFLSKDDAALRQQWAKEGGYEANVQRVLAAEQTILGLSENPAALEAHIATLPDDIQRIAADHMRLTPAGFSPAAGAQRFEQFLDALSPSQFEAFAKWWRGLSRGDQDAILAGISR